MLTTKAFETDVVEIVRRAHGGDRLELQSAVAAGEGLLDVYLIAMDSLQVEDPIACARLLKRMRQELRFATAVVE